ncbi:hypothetical protein EYZ11_000614 [Aspergillus tanneri]|nr:hypothetical protein EYZ11_000614 [Aspergillus tanneri]
MRRFWKDNQGDDSHLWEHEWNKHGTCISTLETHCYDEYYPQQEVVEYFDKTVEVFHSLPTYKTLADAGIVPSYSKTYTRREIEDALSNAHGAYVSLRCRHSSLNEVWYYFNIAGSLQTGTFVPSAPDGAKTNCPFRGIRYQPKSPRKGTPTKGPSEPTTTGAPFSGRGHLVISTLGQRRGCIISHGEWFTSGTCATFRIKKTSDTSFTLQSSKGACSFEQDGFSCGPQISAATEFSAEGNKLSYGGNTTFFADKAPKGRVKSTVFASQDDHPIELEITWKESH